MILANQRKFKTTKGTYYSRKQVLEDYGISISTYYRRKKEIVTDYVPPLSLIHI